MNIAADKFPLQPRIRPLSSALWSRLECGSAQFCTERDGRPRRKRLYEYKRGEVARPAWCDPVFGIMNTAIVYVCMVTAILRPLFSLVETAPRQPRHANLEWVTESESHGVTESPSPGCGDGDSVVQWVTRQQHQCRNNSDIPVPSPSVTTSELL